MRRAFGYVRKPVRSTLHVRVAVSNRCTTTGKRQTAVGAVGFGRTVDVEWGPLLSGLQAASRAAAPSAPKPCALLAITPNLNGQKVPRVSGGIPGLSPASGSRSRFAAARQTPSPTLPT